MIARDVIESGNTSAASIPIALSKLVERREIPAGAPVLLFGFGGGLSYAGQIIRCPYPGINRYHPRTPARRRSSVRVPGDRRRGLIALPAMTWRRNGHHLEQRRGRDGLGRP